MIDDRGGGHVQSVVLSLTSVQHQNNIGSMSRVFWAKRGICAKNPTVISVLEVINLVRRYTTAQQTGDVGPALVHCWTTVYDVGPKVNQRWTNVSCLLGSHH